MKFTIKIIYILLLFFSLNSYADDKISLNRSLVDRQVNKFSVLANYSYFDLWIPSKYGFSLSITPSAQATYDIEYLRGGLSLAWFIDDLGSFTDQRISLLRRSFNGRNSFNFIMGAYYSKTKVHLGSKYLASTSLSDGIDLLQVKNLGVTFGLGNRWTLPSGFTIGADWIAINIPIHNLSVDDAFTSSTSNSSHKDLAEDAIRLFKNVPSVVAFKIQVGYSF